MTLLVFLFFEISKRSLPHEDSMCSLPKNVRRSELYLPCNSCGSRRFWQTSQHGTLSVTSKRKSCRKNLIQERVRDERNIGDAMEGYKKLQRMSRPRLEASRHTVSLFSCLYLSCPRVSFGWLSLLHDHYVHIKN